LRFNGGSALGANGSAGMAIAVTHISAAVASLSWMMIEWLKHSNQAWWALSPAQSLGFLQ
jgi:ammonia channel protein AmtB